MNRVLSLVLSFTLSFLLLAGCGTAAPVEGPQQPTATPYQSPSPSEAVPAVTETVDYASSIVLDLSSPTVKQEVSVKNFVDGDTTHFVVPHEVMANGVLKARFLAVNTPESTGKIEEYGKAASRFTREKLSSAASIIVESETDHWDPDSTGDRYLVWVWYKSEGMSEYRNLNIEILQNGLAIANSSANNQYGDVCMAAINQARAQKLGVYSGQKDPDFYYGDAVELTLKELRTSIEEYSGIKVAFNGVVSANSGTQGVYVEDYDPETERYYGIYIYYGHNLTGAGLDVLSVGNRVRIVGTVQYYEGGGTWQVSDLTYRLMKPDDPGNIQKISEGHCAAYELTDPKTFVSEEVAIQTEEEALTFPYAQLALGTSVEMRDLTVKDIYTTTKEDSSSKGAMTLICQADNVTVTVRTAVLLDENKQLITQDAYEGKTISVKGIVDYFDGSYQIKVFSAQNITITQ